MRTVLPPIAALTAVCISIPAAGVSVANAASTDEARGPASHTAAAPQVALAAATSDLKLVFAKVGSDPGLGAAVTNAGQQFEILALPKNLADNVSANGTGGLPGTVVDAGRQAAANILEAANQASLAADPTASLENNVVSRALQGTADIVFWLSNTNAFPGTLPTGFNTATYTSLFKVAQNLVNVAVLPFTVGNLLLTGQFDDISTTISQAVSTLFTSVTQGLPTSIAQTVGWVLTGQVPTLNTMALNATTVNSMQANPASLAAAADPTASQGQSNAILTTVTNTITTALTSVFQGLPTSFAQTLDGILAGQTPADMGVKATENSLFNAPATGKAVQQDEPDNVDGGSTTRPGGILSGIVNGGGTTNPASATKPGGILSGITKGAGIANGGGATKPGGVLSGITKGAGITKSGASATTAASTTSKSGDTGNKKDGAGKHRSGD